MKLSRLIICCLFGSFLSFAPLLAQKLPLINALALSNGAHVVKATSSQQGQVINDTVIPVGAAEALLDGNLQKGWISATGQATQCVFVFELAETFLLKQIGFNNKQQPKNRSRSIKKVRIEFSSTSATSGYDVEYTLILEANAPIRLMGIQNIRTRWIKITIQSNYGHSALTSFNEIQAWGIPAKALSAINVTGTWQTAKGPISLIQEGNKVTGCYAQNKGHILNGEIQGRKLRFVWEEETTKKYGQVMMVINEEQNRMYGLWDQGKQFQEYGHWAFVKKSSEATKCPDLQKEGAAQTKKE
ncbi:MAG TPA: hypothetical protein DCS93_27735 [Microscillaceae bacterium]|nr:hypothetical protein [Microscillaceae bacterium]